MGVFDAARAAYCGNRAYHAHVDAGKLANEGKVAQAREKYRAALGFYEEAVRLGNDSPNVLLAYAILLTREGEFDRAGELMQRISRMKNLSEDDWFQLRVQYSIYQWATGQLDKAIETIGRAAAHKMNGNIYGTLGMYWVDKARQTGDFGPALDFNRQAMEYDDEDAATLDNMGQLYEAMADAGDSPEGAGECRAKALDYYRRAHEARPRQITTIYNLARMYHTAGDDDRARKLLSVRDTLYFSAVCPVSREMMEALAAEVG